MKLLLAGSSIAVVTALSAAAKVEAENYLVRMKMVKAINNIKGLTWTAGMPDKFKGQPLGSSKSLLGVKDGQRTRLQQKIASGRIVVKQAPEGFVAADEFDSEANWPQCAKVIGDIRDQSNCGCCWAFGGASAASDRLCISTNGSVAIPISSQDVCFGASYDGCGGGYLDDTWEYVQKGAVSGGNQEGTGNLGAGFCQAFSLPHCHHHGPQRDDPYPAEGQPGCPSANSPSAKSKCDSDADASHSDFKTDQYSFSGDIESYEDERSIQAAISAGGPVETAFTVYGDFENYVGGVYQPTSSQVLGGHAVRIVGWGVDSGTKYWKVANSWNPHWGEKGYFRILRGSDTGGIESQAMASAADAQWSYPDLSPTPAPVPTPPTPPPPPTPAPAPTPAAPTCQSLLDKDCGDVKDDDFDCIFCIIDNEDALDAVCSDEEEEDFCGFSFADMGIKKN